MRIAVSIVILASLVSACGGSQLPPEQRAEREAKLAQTDAALSEAKTVTVNGKTFRVAHVTERDQALVNLVGPSTPYFAADIEAASRTATGCAGTFDPGILAFLGGDIATTDLAALRTKVSGRFAGWSVSLEC